MSPAKIVVPRGIVGIGALQLRQARDLSIVGFVPDRYMPSRHMRIRDEKARREETGHACGDPP